tara:strand:+ start:555 stop:791 length:237 start_codon:yes stop_codon:yes gene_type:complete
MNNYDLNDTLEKLESIKEVNPLVFKLWKSNIIIKYKSLIKSIDNCHNFLQLFQENKINLKDINENNILTLTLFLNGMT